MFYLFRKSKPPTSRSTAPCNLLTIYLLKLKPVVKFLPDSP